MATKKAEDTAAEMAAELPEEKSDAATKALLERIAALEERLERVSAPTTTGAEISAKRDTYQDELVTVELFRDSDRYSHDFVVGVNGKLWKIKRGVRVQVPRYVAEVVKRSINQDQSTAQRIRERDGVYVQYAHL